jgi:hypothetical protein
MGSNFLSDFSTVLSKPFINDVFQNKTRQSNVIPVCAAQG